MTFVFMASRHGNRDYLIYVYMYVYERTHVHVYTHRYVCA